MPTALLWRLIRCRWLSFLGFLPPVLLAPLLIGWDGPLARKLPPPDSIDDAFRIRLEWAKAVLDVMVRLHLLSARDTASISAWMLSSIMVGLGFKDKWRNQNQYKCGVGQWKLSTGCVSDICFVWSCLKWKQKIYENVNRLNSYDLKVTGYTDFLVKFHATSI